MGAEAVAAVSKPPNTPRRGGDTHVDNRPAAGGFTTRKEVDGFERRRFRGSGQRGSPATEVRYAVDVRIARGELDAALQMLVDGPAIADHRARRENRKSAVAKIALAARALEVVLAREDSPLPDCQPIRPAEAR